MASIDFVRTPEDRFAGIPDFDYVPKFVDLPDGLRMAYVEEGPADGPVVLLLHGEPTWGYLYRHMIDPLVEAGMRVIAPDLIGFGRSDKPTSRDAYSYASHTDWMLGFLDALELSDITLFCQDWGSLIGLRIVGLHPDRFSGVVVGNGFLPAGQGSAPLPFRIWRAFAKFSPLFPIGRIVAVGTARKLSDEERKAYDAPFPSNKHLAGARMFPALVPTSADDPAMPVNTEAWHGLGQFEKPFLCMFGRKDPILGKADGPLIAHVPGAQGQPHSRVDGSHFVQEDCGPELAAGIIGLIRSSHS